MVISEPFCLYQLRPINAADKMWLGEAAIGRKAVKTFKGKQTSGARLGGQPTLDVSRDCRRRALSLEPSRNCSSRSLKRVGCRRSQVAVSASKHGLSEEQTIAVTASEKRLRSGFKGYLHIRIALMSLTPFTCRILRIFKSMLQISILRSQQFWSQQATSM